MVKKQRRLSKESSQSVRKSQQRSSSISRSKASAESKSSRRSSKSSRASGKSMKSNRDEYKTETKTIYEPEPTVAREKPSGWSRTMSTGLQTLITLFVSIAWIYHLIWGSQPFVSFLLIKALMLELLACFLMVHVSKNNHTGACCTQLTYQFFLLFSAFSAFLQSKFLDASLLETVFSMPTISLMASFIHLSITLSCMQLIGQSVKRNDYSSRLIVESKEKRAGDMYQMISRYMTELAAGNHDVKMNLMVADETGKPMRLNGSAVEATTNSATQLLFDKKNNIEWTSIKTAEASVSVPRRARTPSVNSSTEKEHDVEKVVNNSIYNNCRKQDKMLSPRKVL